MKEKSKVLCVDDEPHVVDAIRRVARQGFAVRTANSGAEGLEIMESSGPFAVVMSDMRMPQMNGAEFLKRARKLAPDTTRILLTGHAEIDAAVKAINEGGIFRFLLKPCPREQLLQALADAAKQHQLVTDQHVLLEQTLRGSIDALTDVLSLSNPKAFGRAGRIRRTVSAFGKQLEVADLWQLEIAAMLSQIGYVTLPADVVEKIASGRPLAAAEREMVDQIPETTERILRNIPRLEGVREILSSTWKRSTTPRPLSASVLQLVLDYEAMVAKDTPDGALQTLASRRIYDAELLSAFHAVIKGPAQTMKIREIAIASLTTTMVIDQEMRAPNGALLVSAGMEVTESLLARIHNMARRGALYGQVRVRVPVEREPELQSPEVNRRPGFRR